MIFDLHNDALTELAVPDLAEYLQANNKRRINYAIFTTKLKNKMLGIESAVRYLKSENELLMRNSDHTFGRKTTNDVLWSIEDLGFVSGKNFSEYTDKIIALKPFCCSLTWNYENALAGGALSEGGLKPLGKKIVKKLECSKILIDTAHQSEKTFYDFASITSYPLLNTHTCFDEVCSHKRNLKKEQLKLIVQSGGLVGLTLVPAFLAKKAQDNSSCVAITDLVKHIDYFAQLFGCDNLAIGTDFFGSASFPKNLDTYDKFDNLQNALLKKGYKQTDIDKIFYRNATNFLARLYP